MKLKLIKKKEKKFLTHPNIIQIHQEVLKHKYTKEFTIKETSMLRNHKKIEHQFSKKSSIYVKKFVDITLI